jgi:hypothetical protein
MASDARLSLERCLVVPRHRDRRWLSSPMRIAARDACVLLALQDERAAAARIDVDTEDIDGVHVSDIGVGAVSDLGGAGVLTGTAGAAEEAVVDLGAVPDHLAAAVLARRCQPMDSALEAVEHVSLASGDDLERLVVVVPADLAHRHGGCPVIARLRDSRDGRQGRPPTGASPVERHPVVRAR